MLNFVAKYRTETPNANTRLYGGPIMLRSDRGEVTSDGVVLLRWLPKPLVCIEIPELAQQLPPVQVGEKPEFAVPNSIGHGRALITGMNMGSDKATSLNGSLNRPLQLGATDGLQSVDFHLVNFGHFTCSRPNDAPENWRHDRMIWEAGEWTLTIDPGDDVRELEDRVKSVGGYIISHTARLTRADGKTFTGHNAQQFWRGLFRFVSFVAGRRMNAILPVGFNSGGEPVWSEWAPWTIDPWKAHESWADLHYGEELSRVFSGYMARRADQNWRDTLDLSIYWYVESNRNPLSTETNIVLSQVALERLAWEHFVRQSGMSKKDFKKINARERITRLLQDYQIPADIPSDYSELNQHNWTDAVEALTALRNDIVHPEQKIARTSRLLWECRQCGLWMLEMLLLRLFDYDGVYADRREPNKFTGKVVSVPWCSSSGQI